MIVEAGVTPKTSDISTAHGGLKSTSVYPPGPFVVQEARSASQET